MPSFCFYFFLKLQRPLRKKRDCILNKIRMLKSRRQSIMMWDILLAMAGGKHRLRKKTCVNLAQGYRCGSSVGILYDSARLLLVPSSLRVHRQMIDTFAIKYGKCLSQGAECAMRVFPAGEEFVYKTKTAIICLHEWSVPAA